MLTRTIAALSLAPIVLGILFWAPPWAFILFILFVSELTLSEYLRLVPGLIDAAARGLLMVLAALLVVGSALGPGQFAPLRSLLILLASFLAVTMYTVLTNSDNARTFSIVAGSLFGLIYIPLSLALLIPVRFGYDFQLTAGGQTYGRSSILFLLLVTWAGDTGAYLAGRSFGKRKLAPRISPGKTVEGAIAGLICSVIVGVFFFFLVSRSPLWVAGAALLSIIGQFGDLFESMLKRGAGVKDSSQLIPGHGGMLDRVDSLLLCCPVLFVMEVGRF
ncbi:MAG TPA: phosphatidate cytidylyltransferase [Acidobacteriota bacterium]|jgi:phosphatidate cytidylyltransferase